MLLSAFIFLALITKSGEDPLALEMRLSPLPLTKLRHPCLHALNFTFPFPARLGAFLTLAPHTAGSPACASVRLLARPSVGSIKEFLVPLDNREVFI